MISIPNMLLRTPIKILNKTGMDVEGNVITTETFDGLCRMVVFDKEKYAIDGDVANYNWVIYIKGDEKVVVDSVAEIDGKEYIIKEVNKHLNVNGSVNHIKLFLE